MARRGWLIVAALASGCVPRGDADTSAFVPTLDPPEITDIAVSCDRDAGRWRFDVTTNRWAGGAVLVWTTDGAYVEAHSGFRSLRQDADGNRDQLRNDVDILTDFRPASNGNTAFACGVGPSMKLWVTDLKGQVADCRRFGDRPALLDVEGLPACPEWFGEPSADTGDTGDTGDEGDSGGGDSGDSGDGGDSGA